MQPVAETKPKVKEVFVLPCCPNGSCLFVSLRCALELLKVRKLFGGFTEENTAGAIHTCPRIDEQYEGAATAQVGAMAERQQSTVQFKMPTVHGFHPLILNSAEQLRKIICNWYEFHLFKEIPELGAYVHNGPTWTRGDILAMEMVSKSKDVPELSRSSNECSTKEAEIAQQRIKCMQQYIATMRNASVWGSTPEYTAFAFMAKCAVKVWQQTGPHKTLFLINEVQSKTFTECVHLLFSGNNHYDLLVEKDDALLMVQHKVVTNLSLHTFHIV